MKKLIVALVTLASVQSFADGFVCETDAGDLRLKVYNKVNPNEGTRSSSVMVVSNPQVGSGRRTIAIFTSDSGLLSTAHNSGLKYIADVDLRFANSNRSGEYLVGTRLGEVEMIKLNIDFTYGDDLADGDETSGRLVVVKRDGAAIVRNATCVRYLKAE